MSTSVFTTTASSSSGPALVGLDPQAAGAVEQHEAVVHVDPYDAAKELRELAREGMGYAEQIKVGLGYDETMSQNLAYLENSMGRVTTQAQASREALSKARSMRSELERLIKERRSAATLNYLGEVFYQLNMTEENLVATIERGKSANIYRQRVNNRWTALISGPQGSSPTNDRVRAILDRIHILAQSIPTVPNMPLGDKAAMTLRAMAAILKANGYITSSVPQEAHAQALEAQVHPVHDDDIEDPEDEDDV